MKWRDISVDIKTLCPGGCLPLPRGYIDVLKHEIKMYKIRLQRHFLKLATNDRSDKMFLLTSKFRPQGVVSPCPGLYTCVKSWKKKMYKIRLQRDFFKLVANDQSDKRFLLKSKFCPLGMSVPDLRWAIQDQWSSGYFLTVLQLDIKIKENVVPKSFYFWTR